MTTEHEAKCILIRTTIQHTEHAGPISTKRELELRTDRMDLLTESGMLAGDPKGCPESRISSILGGWGALVYSIVFKLRRGIVNVLHINAETRPCEDDRRRGQGENVSSYKSYHIVSISHQLIEGKEWGVDLR